AMGAVDSIWSGDLAAHLLLALRTPTDGDRRAVQGAERGGRMLAARVAAAVSQGDA
ncbi:MAG: biotin-independent malonate decarboxylase subunit gamma, partial [Stenotrophomonas maltophilia]